MASLRKRPGSAKWVCCFTLNDGQRTQRSTGQTNRSKALSMCLDWENAAKDAQMGMFSEAQARKVVSTISERAGLGPVDFATTRKFFMDWIGSKEITKAKGTAVRYRHIVEVFLEGLGRRADLSLVAIRPKDITDFRDKQIKEGKSAATANVVVKTLRATFNLARRQGIILTNPAEAVELLPNDSGSRLTFDRKQIKDLLAAADIEWKGMILFGACHGLRIGDAAHLTWENIDLDRHVLRFIAKKTAQRNKRRPEEYPLHPDILAYLQDPKLKVSDNPKAYLFPSLSKMQTGGVGGLSLHFRQLMAKVGIHAEEESNPRMKGSGRRFFSLSFHSLRHTAISEQANIGISKEVRMKLSGHKSDVHERYTHHEVEALRKEIEKVPSFLG